MIAVKTNFSVDDSLHQYPMISSLLSIIILDLNVNFRARSIVLVSNSDRGQPVDFLKG